MNLGITNFKGALMSKSKVSFEEFASKRNNLIKDLNFYGLMELCKDVGIEYPQDPDVFMASVHKVRHSMEVSTKMKEESKQWLISNGFTTHV